MKNTPSNIPSKGLISAWICGLNLLPDNKTPAANAPVAALKPKFSARTPIPAATNNAAATNVSVDLAAATTSKIYLSTYLPRTSTPPNPTVALAIRIPNSGALCGPVPARTGISTNSGATAKSCSSKILSPAIPSGRFSQPFSLMTGNTNAEEDSAPAEAIQNACIGLDNIGLNNPSSRGMNGSTICKMNGPSIIVPKKKNVILAMICKTPSFEKAPRALILSADNDSPSLNSKNKMPKSPSCKSASVFENKFKL
mmetsp:Transcript_27993/g.34547  ORF Transcript_27993/g.34547 Transcript_27993/m.34547 type:complete len:255 (-) Transcript_27993:201-965(-)